MLFRVSWQVEEDNWHECVQRFLSMEDNPNYDLPEGLTVKGRCYNTAARNGTQIFETKDINLLTVPMDDELERQARL